jgi:hypothetical protein
MTDEIQTTELVAPRKAGRPPGARNVARSRQAEVAAKAIRKNVVIITNTMIRMALEGDQKSAEWILNKALGKERLVRFPMMPIEKPEDVKTAIAGFINAVSLGLLSVTEAEKLVSMASKLGDAIDATEHADIMKQLAEKAGIEINDTL